ncbi:MAG: hypothetical protein QXW18_04740 [Candidatus Bathyarchaeia archaeon]
MTTQVGFKGGKATKRTRFGRVWKSQSEGTLKSGEFCAKAGLNYHVIDSEWKWHYLMPYEAEKLVNSLKGLVTVLTFSSRHHGVLRLIDRTVNALTNCENFGLNLVVGNKAFLDWREVRRPPKATLIDSIKFVRRCFDGKVFVGAEGLVKTAAELAVEYNLIPFLLLDKDLEENLAVVKDIVGSGDIAVYVPYLISKNYPRLLNDILYRLAGYILRRKWVQEELKKLGYDPLHPKIRAIGQEKRPLTSDLMTEKLSAFLKSAANMLTIYGGADTVTARLTLLKKLGVTIVVGLPIKENEQQILAFGECVLKAACS